MKRTASKKTAKKTAGLVKSAESAASKRAKELLALIARRVQRITEDFYDIGAALRELHEKKLYAALGFASLGDLLKAHKLMSRSRAFELMHIVRTVPRKEALALGAEKSYALARLTAATKELDTVEEVADEGVVIGGKKRKVADVTIRELERKVKEERAKSRPAKTDPDEKKANAAARGLQASLRKRGAKSATVSAAKHAGGWFLDIRLPLDRLDLVGG